MAQLLDKNLRTALETFWTAAQASAVTEEAGPQSFDLGNIRITNGILFSVSPEASQAQADVIRIILKRLGAARGHEGQMQDILWGLAASALNGDDVPDPAKEAARLIEEEASRTHRLIAPCLVVGLEGAVDEIKIGPVRIVKGCPRVERNIW